MAWGMSVKCTPIPPLESTTQTVRWAIALPAVTASHAAASVEQARVQRSMGLRDLDACFLGSIADLLRRLILRVGELREAWRSGPRRRVRVPALADQGRRNGATDLRTWSSPHLAFTSAGALSCQDPGPWTPTTGSSPPPPTGGLQIVPSTPERQERQQHQPPAAPSNACSIGSSIGPYSG